MVKGPIGEFRPTSWPGFVVVVTKLCVGSIATFLPIKGKIKTKEKQPDPVYQLVNGPLHSVAFLIGRGVALLVRPAPHEPAV